MFHQDWPLTLPELFTICNVSLCLSDEVMSTDQTVLRHILENHILKLKITLSELYNGQLLETLAGKLLRVFIYRTVRTMCVFVCVLLHQRVEQHQGGTGKKLEVMEGQ